MKKRIIVFFCFIACLWIVGNSIYANTIRVGVMLNQPPFSYLNKNNKPFGLSVSLWEKIAKKNNFKYRYILLRNTSFDDAMSDVAKNKYDVLVGPFSVTHDRLKLVDFSRPYFLDKIGIAIHKQQLNFLSAVANIFGDMLIILVCVLLLLLLMFGAFLWYVEHKNHEQIPAKFSKGLGYITWIALISLFKNFMLEPRTVTGRILLLAWLALSFVFMTVILSVATSTLTVTLSRNASKFTRNSDLYNKVIAVEYESSNEKVAREIGASIYSVKSLTQGLNLVAEKKVEAVLANYYILDYFIKHHHLKKVTMAKLIIANDEYAFVLPKHSKLTRKIDLAITKFQENRVASNICTEHLGKAHEHSCEF